MRQLGFLGVKLQETPASWPDVLDFYRIWACAENMLIRIRHGKLAAAPIPMLDNNAMLLLNYLTKINQITQNFKKKSKMSLTSQKIWKKN